MLQSGIPVAELAITRAGMEAVPDVYALIRDIAQWLIDRGDALWGEEEISHDELTRVARGGELITGRVAGALAACMYLHDEDRVFWPETRAGEALYVHRLGVARRFAGAGYSQAMLDWALHEARRMGRDFVRLDCEPRPKLVALYRDAGFTPVDPGPVQVGRHWVLRQQKAA
ncbi:MAG TPA: GNAT family N-acetyltransferase [Micropepsaceae bacterium]|nr:GNAT family N-acetyltransferase [Micropepsaceae bacterium]